MQYGLEIERVCIISILFHYIAVYLNKKIQAHNIIQVEQHKNKIYPEIIT